MESKEFETGGIKFTISMVSDEIMPPTGYMLLASAAKSDAVYLAVYSGRVVLVNGQGRGRTGL